MSRWTMVVWMFDCQVWVCLYVSCYLFFDFFMIMTWHKMKPRRQIHAVWRVCSLLGDPRLWNGYCTGRHAQFESAECRRWFGWGSAWEISNEISCTGSGKGAQRAASESPPTATIVIVRVKVKATSDWNMTCRLAFCWEICVDTDTRDNQKKHGTWPEPWPDRDRFERLDWIHKHCLYIYIVVKLYMMVDGSSSAVVWCDWLTID